MTCRWRRRRRLVGVVQSHDKDVVGTWRKLSIQLVNCRMSSVLIAFLLFFTSCCSFVSSNDQFAESASISMAVTRQTKDYAAYYDEFTNFIMRNISLKDPPALDSGYATNVELFFEIERILAINEATMEISLSFFLRQTWIDGRIAKIFARQQGPAEFRLDDGTWDHIWVPDVFFRNGLF